MSLHSLVTRPSTFESSSIVNRCRGFSVEIQRSNSSVLEVTVKNYGFPKLSMYP